MLLLPNKQQWKNICQNYKIIFLGIFGSYASNTAKKHSDLDLLVRFSKTKSILELINIERTLSQQLGIKIDLITEQSLSPYLEKNIKKELKIVYEKR